MPEKLPTIWKSLLKCVTGPGRYVGGEHNAVIKPDAALRVALAFPDAYEIGMSHHGLQILYALANRLEGVAAERVFAPWPDFETELRRAGEPLRTLETFAPLADCDAIGFSLCYELAAPTVLNMLDLGRVPLLAADRKAGAPLVLAGGHAAFNPEPMADFIDAFFIGEAEDAWPRLLELIKAAGGRHCADRTGLLKKLAQEIPGLYVPALYETTTNADGFVLVKGPKQDAPWPIRRQVVSDFEQTPLPLKPVTPVYETVHERIVLEIMRGCPHGCRFCQAGMICRPVRQRSVGTLLDAAKCCYRATGYDEIGLLSLSSSNYRGFDELLSTLDREFAPRSVSLSLPSLRIDEALRGLPSKLKSVRKSGLTIAPEAGTDRLRTVINKDVTNENLLAAAAEAYAHGWKSIKLYFMVGLPTETDADAAAISELAGQVARLRQRGGREPAVHLAVSNFVPKPHTPFQWEPMAAADTLRRRQQLARQGLDSRKVAFKGHDYETSWLEGVLARGDRRLGQVIRQAWEKGARLDGWNDFFDFTRWQTAFAAAGLDGATYAHREWREDEVLPWSHIETGLSDSFLRRERSRSREAQRTPSCAPGQCAGCGVDGCEFDKSQT